MGGVNNIYMKLKELPKNSSFKYIHLNADSIRSLWVFFFKILKAWFNSVGFKHTVQEQIELVKDWYQRSYLYPSVWEGLRHDLRDKINPRVLPSKKEVRQMISKLSSEESTSQVRR